MPASARLPAHMTIGDLDHRHDAGAVDETPSLTARRRRRDRAEAVAVRHEQLIAGAAHRDGCRIPARGNQPAYGIVAGRLGLDDRNRVLCTVGNEQRVAARAHGDGVRRAAGQRRAIACRSTHAQRLHHLI